MADGFEIKNNLRRRRCYYKFSKDYPGSRYDKNKKRSTSDELDTKRYIIKKTGFALLLVFLFLLTYFIVYTIIGISHEEIEGFDEIGKPIASVTENLQKEDLSKMTDDLTAEETTQETTVFESETKSTLEETTVSDILE